jgi:hypothetical protein
MSLRLTKLFINVSDSLNVSESDTELLNKIILSVSDSFDVSESDIKLLKFLISISDSLNLSESDTELLNKLILNVSDSLNLSESTTQTSWSGPLYVDNGGIVAGINAAIDLTYPATVDANDILIACLMDADNDDFDTPAGWTQILEYTTQANLSGAWYWKRADGTEGGGTVTFTSTLSAGQVVAGIMYRFSGCKTTGVPYEDATGASPAQASNCTVSTITTTGTNRLAVAFVTVEDNVSVAEATGYTEESELQDTTGTDLAFSCQTQQKRDAGDVNGSTPSLGGNDYSTVLTLALLPEAIETLNIDVSDSINISEFDTELLNKLILNVSDSFNLSESDTELLNKLILSVSDSVNFSEAFAKALKTTLQINVSDSFF